MARLILKSPLPGWVLPLTEIPDPVFAQGMAGEGVGIDPTGDVLHAPCAGEVTSVAGAAHAIGLRSTEGVDLLLHVGIDTVGLAGAGFEPLVRVGQTVACGQPLLRFDLDRVVRRAPSAITPILVVGGGRLLQAHSAGVVAVGDVLMEIAVEAEAKLESFEGETQGAALRRRLVVGFEHGLHARPASQLAAAIRPFAAKVSLHAKGGEANARSAVAVMALGVGWKDEVEVIAVGSDAEAALEALAAVLMTAAPAVAASPAQASDTALTGPVLEPVPGLVASRGLALGTASFLQEVLIEVSGPEGDAAHEGRRLASAISAISARALALADAQSGAQREILLAHAQLVDDPGLAEHAQQHIGRGRSAGQAWQAAIAQATQALERLADPRLRERVADLRDVEHQVLAVLAGAASSAAMELPENAIVIAEDLLPSQLIGLDRQRLAGLCIVRGGPTSHMAIIAAALGLPALVATGSRVLDIEPGSVVFLNAERGFLQAAPDPAQQQEIAAALSQRERQKASDLAEAGKDALTLDGQRIRVRANLGAASEAGMARERGAEGCGLLRTEFLFLQRQSPPDEGEQFEHYREILERLAPGELTIRTMDIGGDKPIPYLPLSAEENPALGLRGVRTSLAHPELLRTQLRAILRLGRPEHCSILLPMVTDVGDVRAVRELLAGCAQELGITRLPRLGAMIETPASALLAEQLLEQVDFLSIGTNDLSQYVLAMDRGHPSLAARLDALHPAVLRLIASVAAAGRARGRQVAVCGGLGSDPQAIAVLVGLGIGEVSAVPGAIPEIKRIIRSLDSAACRELAGQALELDDAKAVRELVARWTLAGTDREAHR